MRGRGSGAVQGCGGERRGRVAAAPTGCSPGRGVQVRPSEHELNQRREVNTLMGLQRDITACIASPRVGCGSGSWRPVTWGVTGVCGGVARARLESDASDINQQPAVQSLCQLYNPCEHCPMHCHMWWSKLSNYELSLQQPVLGCMSSKWTRTGCRASQREQCRGDAAEHRAGLSMCSDPIACASWV